MVHRHVDRMELRQKAVQHKLPQRVEVGGKEHRRRLVDGCAADRSVASGYAADCPPADSTTERPATIAQGPAQGGNALEACKQTVQPRVPGEAPVQVRSDQITYQIRYEESTPASKRSSRVCPGKCQYRSDQIRSRIKSNMKRAHLQANGPAACAGEAPVQVRLDQITYQIRYEESIPASKRVCRVCPGKRASIVRSSPSLPPTRMCHPTYFPCTRGPPPAVPATACVTERIQIRSEPLPITDLTDQNQTITKPCTLRHAATTRGTRHRLRDTVVVQYSMFQYGTVRYSAVQHVSVRYSAYSKCQCGIVRYSAVQHVSVRYSAYSAVQHVSVWCSAVW